ncbi:hypothetical protein ABRP72_19545 [Pectobacterium carotovorum]|uniref:hypothetical protein n=1 Tax=Pectobacterium carotovorum TaxID=554 RepID=UPI0032F01BA1
MQPGTAQREQTACLLSDRQALSTVSESGAGERQLQAEGVASGWKPAAPKGPGRDSLLARCVA